MTDTQDEPQKWEVAKIPGIVVRVDERDQVASVRGRDEQQMLTRARLIAAAGTAAHELPAEYDPVAAVEALPTGLEQVRCAIIDLLDGPPGETDEPAIRSAISRLVEFLDDAGDEEVSEIVDDIMLDAARGE